MNLPVLNGRPVLGHFGKAVPGSVSVSFGTSGGQFCDRSCRYHPDSTHSTPDGGCYAVRTEKRPDRGGLRPKLVRHEQAGPEKVARLARLELEARLVSGEHVPWLRLSTSGSVPPPKMATDGFIKALRELFDFTDSNNIPTHFPVESPAKARFYREHLSWRVVVRESCQSERRFLTAPGAVSVVAGTRSMSCTDRMVEARRIARRRRDKTGRKTIICPAVAVSRNYLNRGEEAVAKAKCGNCTACSMVDVDIVYPLH